MTTNCVSATSDYAHYLNSNPDVTGIVPHPLFFSGLNCTGTSWPPYDTEYTTLTTIPNPDTSGRFGSFYIPAGWTVTFDNVGESESITLPSIQNGSTTFLESSAANLFFNGSANPLVDDISQVTVTPPTSMTTRDWKYLKCMGKISSTVGITPITAFKPQSAECDSFMNSFCDSSSPSDADRQEVACKCLEEEAAFNSEYCEPNSSNTNCNDYSDTAQFIPVKCFGKRCSSGSAYRFSRMDVPCNITLCQQLVELSGSNIEVNQEMKMICGNEDTSIESNNSSKDSNPKELKSVTAKPKVVRESLESWQIIVLISVIVLLVLATVASSIAIFRSGKLSTRLVKKPISTR